MKLSLYLNGDNGALYLIISCRNQLLGQRIEIISVIISNTAKNIEQPFVAINAGGGYSQIRSRIVSLNAGSKVFRSIKR